LGKTKLMKLFFFLDFNSVKKYGVPITYDQYFKLERGPIPTEIKNMVDALDSPETVKEALLRDTIKIKRGIRMHRIIPVRKIEKEEMGMFSKNEITLLQSICNRFGDSTTKEVEKVSHSGVWEMVSMTEKIPYELAAKEKDCKVPEKMIKLALDIHYGSRRSSQCS
jgi:hypothetical protein